MFNYTLTKDANLDKLTVEIKAVGLPLSCINGNDSSLEIVMITELDEAQQSQLATVITAHQKVTAAEVVKAKILAAMDFGRQFTAEYGASNVLAGLTLAEVEYMMEATAKLQQALLTGSLYVALVELARLPTDDTIITVAKVTEARNKIQTYLGITLT